MPTATKEKNELEINHGGILEKIEKLGEQLKTTSIQDIYNNLLAQIKEGTAPSLEVLVDVKSNSFRFIDYDKESGSVFASGFQRFSYSIGGMKIEFYHEVTVTLGNALVSDLVVLEKALPLLITMTINGIKTPVSILQELATLLK